MCDDNKYVMRNDISEQLKTDNQHFGVVLRNARKSINMTQQQVANKAGITLRHYQMFESGEREIINASFRVAMAVIMTLDINPENIIHNGIYVPCDNVEKRIKNDC